jgi:hypothetical protein
VDDSNGTGRKLMKLPINTKELYQELGEVDRWWSWIVIVLGSFLLWEVIDFRLSKFPGYIGLPVAVLGIAGTTVFPFFLIFYLCRIVRGVLRMRRGEESRIAASTRLIVFGYCLAIFIFQMNTNPYGPRGMGH